MGGENATARPAMTMIVIATLGLASTYLAVPVDWVRASIMVVGGLAAAVAILLFTGRRRPQDPLPSWLLATSIALVTSGQAVALLGQPSPSYADIPRLLAYPAMAGAVIAFQRDRIRHDRASLLDALVVTVAAAQAG